MRTLLTATFLFSFAFLMAHAESSASDPISIIRKADSITRERLEPWIETFLAKPRKLDPITEYEIVAFDDELLTRLRYGEESGFLFKLNDKYSYSITSESISDFDGGWILSGYLSDRNDRSDARTVTPRTRAQERPSSIPAGYGGPGRSYHRRGGTRHQLDIAEVEMPPHR